jgi:AraC-like DNA-binding protein
MLQSDDVGGAPQLDFGVWRGLLRSNCGDWVGPPQPFSSRHVRSLLAERGMACGELVDSHRLDDAAHLLQRRALFGMGQPLNENAVACAFRDDAYFTRKFHKPLDDSPGACAGRDSGGDAVRAGTGKSASPARDVPFRTS